MKLALAWVVLALFAAGFVFMLAWMARDREGRQFLLLVLVVMGLGLIFVWAASAVTGCPMLSGCQ